MLPHTPTCIQAAGGFSNTRAGQLTRAHALLPFGPWALSAVLFSPACMSGACLTASRDVTAIFHAIHLFREEKAEAALALLPEMPMSELKLPSKASGPDAPTVTPCPLTEPKQLRPARPHQHQQTSPVSVFFPTPSPFSTRAASTPVGWTTSVAVGAGRRFTGAVCVFSSGLT